MCFALSCFGSVCGGLGLSGLIRNRPTPLSWRPGWGGDLSQPELQLRAQVTGTSPSPPPQPRLPPALLKRRVCGRLPAGAPCTPSPGQQPASPTYRQSRWHRPRKLADVTQHLCCFTVLSDLQVDIRWEFCFLPLDLEFLRAGFTRLILNSLPSSEKKCEVASAVSVLFTFIKCDSDHDSELHVYFGIFF